MSLRLKLAAAALGALVIALSLLVPVVPKSTPPGMVDQVKLQEPPDDEQRAVARHDTVTPDRRSRRDRRRSQRGTRKTDRAAVSPQRGSNPGGVRRADVTQPSADSPTGQHYRESVSAPRRSPAPRSTPVRVNLPAPDHPAPEHDPDPGPPERPDPPDADATAAVADPPDQPEPADPPDADVTTAAADPPEDPEPAGVDPSVETP